MPGIADATGVQWRNGDFYDHVLTDYYESTLVSALNDVTAWYDQTETDSKDIVAGKHVVWINHTGRNIGVQYQDSRGFLPDPGAQEYDTSFQHLKNFYGRIKIDGETMDSDDQGASYADAVDTEMSRAIVDARIQFQRASFNDGSGRLCEVNGAPAANVVTVRMHAGIYTGTGDDNSATKWIQPGMRLMFMTPAGATPVVATVVSVDSATQITVDDDTGIADNDWVVMATRTGSTSIQDSSFRQEPPGLEGFFSDTGILDGNGLEIAGAPHAGAYDFTETVPGNAGFQGVLADAAHDWNQAVVVDNGGTGRDNSEALMQTLVSTAEETNNALISMLLSSYATYDQFVNLLIDLKRFSNTDLRGGHRVLDFNGIPWYKDKDCHKNRVYAIDLGQFRKKEKAPIRWLNQTGSIWEKVVDKDAWEAAFVRRHTCVVDLRQRIGAVLRDLND